MQQISCENGSCKKTQKIWGLVSLDEKKLHRLTFSQSLAEMIVKNYPQYKVKSLNFVIGRNLQQGETSKSGLYALMSKKGDFALRITLIKGIAEIHNDEYSRYLAEAWLE